jgi:hypothetical protein
MRLLQLIKANRWFSMLLALVVVVKFFSLFPHLVERYYANGIYPKISIFLRLLTGWAGFSIGDLLYSFLVIYLSYRLIRFFWLLRKKKFDRIYFFQKGKSLLQLLLTIYLIFYLFWGLNYNRLGIAHQLQLDQQAYSTDELLSLNQYLVHQLDSVATLVKDTGHQQYNNLDHVWQEAKESYALSESAFPFLKHGQHATKSSVYSLITSYLGVSGYYNPFSGEAQLNNRIPNFLRPAVACHEMAHQLGYASESEANFIAYLTCKNNPNTSVQYSIYFELMQYALFDLAYRDTTLAKGIYEQAPKRFKTDRKLVRAFFKRYQNPVEPIISWVYDKYLKVNDQPSGKQSYNEVVGWLIAYRKKY